jgi:lipoprotein NlpD
LKQEIFRLPDELNDFFPRGRSARVCVFLLIMYGLAGCTAAWRAPVEARGTHPTPAAAKSPRGSLRADEYRVRSGHTLISIAWQKGVDYRSIASWNGIPPPYRIYSGQTLRLKPPISGNNTSTVKTSKARPIPATRTAAKPIEATAPKSTSRKTSKPAAAKTQLAWRWPAKGRIVSSFKAGDPLRKGIKIAGRSGKPIVAAESGKVVYSGSGLIGYGRLIIVKHNDNYLSAYGHNRKILVKEGDRVTKGIKIAEMGTANSGDPMLHFEIRRDGKPVDPMRLLPRL